MAAIGRLNFSINLAEMSDDCFLVIEFTGREGVPTVYQYDIQLVSRFDNMKKPH
ncbi:hypothetical protein [Celerinatantimonas yamalensis]|uniref:Uncharacterized protein n=1 Tax=Celerinatantimonas yamalensis TaxID=559956 RepID=A0ABW9G5Y2_9GAMM